MKLKARSGQTEAEEIATEAATGAEQTREWFPLAELLGKIKVLSSAKNVKTRNISRSQVRKAFTPFGAVTKYEIALEIAKQFPQLELRLPRIRKPWMSEDERMNIFDAVALALTFSYSHTGKAVFNALQVPTH